MSLFCFWFLVLPEHSLSIVVSEPIVQQSAFRSFDFEHPFVVIVLGLLVWFDHFIPTDQQQQLSSDIDIVLHRLLQLRLLDLLLLLRISRSAFVHHVVVIVMEMTIVVNR